MISTNAPTRAPLFSGGAQHRAFLPAIILSILLTFPTPLRATTLPQLQSLITQLGSDDPHTRDTALGCLMDLHRADLPMLRAAALSLSPLMPGQVDALRQAVDQVYLAGEPYRIDPTFPGGFIGIQFPPDIISQSEGVVFFDLIPGFPGFHYLRYGDVIIKLLDRPRFQIRNRNDFISAVALFQPGDTIHLMILRSGRQLAVSVPLDYCPVDVTPETVSDWIDRREKRAAAYWNSEFSMIDPSASPASVQASADVEP